MVGGYLRIAGLKGDFTQVPESAEKSMFAYPGR
jgi:hypothetical protein